MGDYILRNINTCYGAVWNIGAEPGRDGAGAAAHVEDFVVWLDLGQEECSVFGGGTGGVGMCDGIVMLLGIAALVGARGSHYLIPSEGIRHCSVTIL